MQMMVRRGVVYRPLQAEEDFLGKAVDFYQYLNKTLGTWYRAELDQRLSYPVVRSMKLYAYESMGWYLGLAAHTVSWIFRQFS